MISSQPFHNWQQAPMQGAIAQPNDWQKEALADDLNTALPFLQSAFDAAKKVNLGESHYELWMAICDALNATSEAIQRLDDVADE